MLISEIKSRLDSIKKSIEFKGYTNVSVTFSIDPAMEYSLYISYYGMTGEDRTYIYKSFFGPDFENLYSQWLEYLVAMPSKEETDRQAYFKALAKVVELGEKLSLETPMINPLREIMERLSSNALTHQPYPVDDEGVPLF